MAAATAVSATQPGEDSKCNANDAAKGQVRVLGEGLADVEEDLLKGGDGELGLEGLGGIDDLVESLQDGRAADENVVAGHGSVPVLSVLLARVG